MQDINCTLSDTGITIFNTNKFNYKWIIKNFIIIENQTFQSPEFHTSNNKYQWCIEFNVGPHCLGENPINVTLKLLSQINYKLKAKLKISFINTNNKTEKFFEISKFYVFQHYYSTCKFKMTNKTNFENKSSVIYPKGDLTILCKMILYDGTTRNTSLKTVRETNEAFTEKKLSDDFNLLFEKKMHSDVSLISAEMTEFSAHKAILSARSPVFCAMFESDMVEKKNSRVKIDDCSATVLQEMLRYIYTGQVNDLENTQEELFQMADKYQLSGLKLICSKVLLKKLNTQNVAKVLVLSELHEDLAMKTNVISFIVANAKEIIETEEFKKAMDSYPNLGLELFRAMS